MARSEKLVGVDIGTTTVRCVEVLRKRDTVYVTAFGYAPVTDASDRGSAVAEALRRGKIKTKRVAAALSGRLVPVRYISMPRMPEDEMREAIRAELGKYMPFDPEDAVMDFEILGGPETQPEVQVRLVAAKREAVEQWVKELRKAGVYPVVMDHDSFALSNAFVFQQMHRDESGRDGRVVALIDIGASKTSINIVAEMRSLFSREIDSAGSALTEAVGRRLNISFEEAEQLKCNPGDRREEVLDAIAGVVDDIMGEVSLSFDYFEGQYDRRVEQVYLCGGTCLLDGVLNLVGDHFDIPVDVWNPIDGLHLSLPAHQEQQMRSMACSLAVVMGLAARVVAP